MSISLHMDLTTLREVHCFLAQFPDQHYSLVESVRDLFRKKDAITAFAVRRHVVNIWAAIMRTQPRRVQGDGGFQLKLTIAIESHILSRVYDRLFAEICEDFVIEDSHFERHCQNLSAAGVSGEDFNIPDGYSIDLMSAVVELAALDTFTCPLEKFNCLNETLALMAAELKAAIADTYWAANGNMTVMEVTTKDMEPFLCTVLVRAKPMHLTSNLHFLRNYQSTVSPLDPSWATLLTFEVAQARVLDVDPQAVASHQQARMSVHRGLSVEDILKWSYTLDSSVSKTTLQDRRMDQVLSMVTESTLNGSLSGLEQLATDDDDDGHDYEDNHYAKAMESYRS